MSDTDPANRNELLQLAEAFTTVGAKVTELIHLMDQSNVEFVEYPGSMDDFNAAVEAINRIGVAAGRIMDALRQRG